MKNAFSVLPIRPRHLLWLPVLATITWAALAYGTPHLRIRYSWSGDSSAQTFYRCDYWGAHPFTLNNPLGGDCPLVVLARAAQ